MATHPLFKSKMGWDHSSLPDPLNVLASRSTDSATFSEYHDSGKTYTTLHTGVTRAVLEYCKGEDSTIGLVKVADGVYATEYQQPDGTTTLFYLAQNGSCKGAICKDSGRYEALGTIGSASDNSDFASIFLAVLAQLAEKSTAVADTLAKVFSSTDPIDVTQELYYLSDAVYYALDKGEVKVTMTGGNISILTAMSVKMGTTNGTVMCGKPTILTSGGKETDTGIDKTMTLTDARKKFAKWRERFSWTVEEEMLIPDFPDDYPVPPETMKLCSRYVSTHEARRPMVNFMWRGITSYGKSTGVELMANILHMPLVRMTCNSSMETQDFLSNIIPVDNSKNVTVKLPSFEEMSCDPESAYMAITGEEKENATPDDCLAAYAEIVAAQSGNGGNLYKQVESNFVKGLARGYIVEVQEISRIKDSGVLVGLNEYDRPGAVIPLVDGSSVCRHPDAVVVYTDNVGYASCRPIDPSVLRRMAFVLDSYKLPRKDAIERVIYNTGFEDKALLEKMYDIWEEIGKYCTDRDITEGSVSVTELEMWAMTVMGDDYGNLRDNCIDCVVSKATSVPEEQDEIKASVLAVHLAA